MYWASAVLLVAAMLGETMCTKNAKIDKSNMAVSPPVYSLKHIPNDCWNFTFGQWKRKEFYTPKYPKNYTINADCVNTITAPKGHIIELDFREKFHLEGSKCKYDFLEVRDGPFGYSPLIGRFCGYRYPPLIETTQRHMWLRFATDGVLNYGGFKAVYKFKSRRNYSFEKKRKPSRQACQVMFSSDTADRKLSTEVDLPYKHMEESKQGELGVDCTWHITTDPNKMLLFRATKFEVIDVENCADNFVEVYDGTTLPKDLVTTFCLGKQQVIKTRTNKLFVRMFGKSIYHKPTLEAIYTPYWLGEERDSCPDHAHSCGNFVCMSSSTRCNRNQNCDNYSDETNCSEGAESVTEGTSIPLYAIVLAVVGGFLMVVIVITICCTCRHHKHKRKAAREQSTQSGSVRKRQSVIDARKSPSRRLSNGNIPNSRTRSPLPATASPVPSLTKADVHPSRPDSGFTETVRTLDLEFHDELADGGKFKRFKSMDYYPESQLGSLKSVSKPYVYYSDADLKYENFYPPRTIDRAHIKVACPLADMHPISTVHEHSHFLTIPTPQRYADKHKVGLSPTSETAPSYADTPYNYPL